MTTETAITVRSSSMRLAVLCSASASGERPVLVDTFDATATDGTDVHRAIALSIQGHAAPAFEGDNAADNEGMVELALSWFNTNIRPLYPDLTVRAEVRLAHDFLAGTIDVLLLNTNRSIVIDWKTTHREDDHSAQLYSYAYLVFLEFPEIEEVEIFTAYLRGEGVHRKVLTREFIMAWAAEVKHNIIDHPEIYRTGEHCLRCPRRIGCPAIIETNRQTAHELLDGKYRMTAMLHREMVADLRPKVKLLEASIKAFNDFVRADVLENGPIPTEEGKELRALPMKFEHINIVHAWPILQEEFTDGEMAGFVEVKKTKLLAAISEKTPKGKGKAQEAYMDRLKAAGAVSTTEGVQVREVSQK